jgi:hypothetical protein
MVDGDDGLVVLQDVEVARRHLEAAVEQLCLVVEVAHEQPGRLGDPHSAVVELDVGRRDALVEERHRGDREGEDRDGRHRCSGRLAAAQCLEQPHTVPVFTFVASLR